MLNQIIDFKRQEVAERKRLYPVQLLQESTFYAAPCVSLKSYLTRANASGVIAEFKRKSPSNGQVPVKYSVEEVSIGYMQSGASALSILTDQEFFAGSMSDLQTARQYNYCPILCKDFIIDPYQIHEARSNGADVILLIAAILAPAQIGEYIGLAHELGMETLLELHRGDRLTAIDTATDLIGVNNRDLRTMTTDLAIAEEMMPDLPEEHIHVAESGMHGPHDLLRMRKCGFQGFLIGTHFMRSGDPAQACNDLIVQFNSASDA